MGTTDAALVQSEIGARPLLSQYLCLPGPCALWIVELKLKHLDWNPEATLILFQGQHLGICELEYNILQNEIQNIPKKKAAVEIGEFCLVEDTTSCHWYRGRVQNRTQDLFDVFLIDHGNVLSVDIDHISSCSNDVFILPPKIVFGFLSNVLLPHGCSSSGVEKYFSSLIGTNITGHIQALLPDKVHLLEAPDINNDLVKHGFGRHVDTDTFLLLLEMLTEVPLKQNVNAVPDLLILSPRRPEFNFEPSGLELYKKMLTLSGPKLRCGSSANVRVTAAVNPGLFYCQMTNVEDDLWKMSKKLADVCESRAKDHSQQTPENLGLLCAVKGKDGKWCRGFVQSLPVNSQVRVLFIDYGFFESVKVENIHKMPPDLYSTPIMAFRCSLSGQEEAVKNHQLSLLKAGLLGEFLDVEIGHFDEEEQIYSIKVIRAQENVKKPEATQKPIKPKPVLGTEGSSLDRGFYNCDKVMDQAFSKTLEEEAKDVGSVFVGYVEHVEDPNNFWIRTQERNAEFEEMMKKMEAHFRHVRLDEDVLLYPETGMLCCAVYEEDMHFYRGIVTDTLEYGAEVFFIDFGNVQKVPHKLIKKMPEGFADNSAFALRCSLVNVTPFDDVWSTEKIDFFRQAVSNKALLVHIVQLKKNKFVVDLCEMGDTKMHSITDFLVSSKQAEFLNDHMMETAAQNDQQQEGGKNAKSGVPTSFKALTLQPGCELPVKCSSIDSASDFWCQPLDKLLALEDMMSEIHQYYETHRVPLQYGDVCCVARFPQDGRWYRALIKERENGQAKVILVDYGFTIHVREKCLQRIMPQYMDLEGQAFRCSLFNLTEPVENESSEHWSHEIADALKEFSHDSIGHMRCKVFSQSNMKGKELYHLVDLYNTQTQQSITNIFTEHPAASAKQASVAFPEAFVYSSFDLSPKSEEQVLVTHINSQWEIYCHIERNFEVIYRLEEEISEKSEKMKQASTKGVARNLCLAKYIDGKWYRGLVSTVASPLHLNVFFVDYGNMDICEKSCVMFIPRDSDHLLYTPMQALKLNLASVSKEELYIDVQEWLQGAILSKTVRAVVVGMNEDGSLDVELFDGDTNINEKVNELITSLSPKPKAAVTIKRKNEKKTTLVKVNVVNKACSSLPKSQGPSSHNSEDHKCTRAQGQSSRGGYSMKNYTEGKAQNKNANMKSKPELLAHKNQNTAKPPKFSKVKETWTRFAKTNPPRHQKKTENPQLFSLPGSKVRAGLKSECFVSHINSASSFSIQLSEDNSTILKMSENLNSSVSRESLKHASNLKIGDLVLAEYEEDAALYRAILKDHDGASRHRVEFLDFGNSAVLEKEKIYSLPKEYLIHARLSISCTLLDTSIHDSVESFTDAVMEKPLMVHFVRESGGLWEVEIEVHDTGDGLLVTTEQDFEAAAIKKEPESSLTLPEMEEEVESTEKTHLKIGSKEERIESRRKIEREHLPLTPPLVRHLTPPPTETPKETAGERFADGIPLQHLTFAPIEIDKAYFGQAAAVTTPFEFCVVLEDSFLTMNSVSAVLDDLAEELPPLPEGYLIPGTCCMLKSDTKNKWCRTEILSVNTTVTLKMVDYGHCESLPRSDCFNLKRVPEELIKLPKVAYPCSLKGVKPVGLQWNNDATVFFQECLYLKDLEIFFREPELNTYWEVDVLAEGVQVAMKLVDAGHAVFMNDAPNSSFLELHPSESLRRGLVAEEDHDQEDKDSSRSWYLSCEDVDDTVEAMPVIDERESNRCLLM